MVIAWLRSLLIFDGFLSPNSTAIVPTFEPTGESWFRQLLVLDGFLEAEREVQSVTELPLEVRVAESPKSSLPSVPSENFESKTTVALASPESVVPETTASETFEPEISPHSEEAVTDWQRILGWKE